MHIVIVTPYYAPAWGYGGPPKVLSLYAQELVTLGHLVSVITTDVLDTGRNTKTHERIHGVQVHRFRTCSNFLAYKQKIFFVPDLLAKSKDIIYTADVVLFSDIRSLLNLQLYGYVCRQGIRYGVFAFGQIPYSHDWKEFFKKCFDIIWVRRFIQRASWCFAQTEHEKKMFRQFFRKSPAQTYVVPLPVEKPKNTTHVNFFSYGITPRNKIILFVGRFNYLKGVDILIRSCIPFLRKNHELRLVLIGRDDGEEQILLKMVPKDLKISILFPGAVYGNTLSAWYKRANCFAFTPRYFEETSTAALESLSYGCPVVTVNESQIPYLTEYNAGMTVRNNPSLIRNAIQKVIHNRKMKLNAIHLITDHYDAIKIASQIASIVQPV